jgi:dihydroneopterin aldolase/2-amino-4-hydroxy-6-hydroxymethyldihydropteridine diphosphokinase
MQLALRLLACLFVLAPLQDVAPERCPEGWDDTLPPEGVHCRGPLRPSSER